MVASESQAREASPSDVSFGGVAETERLVETPKVREVAASESLGFGRPPPVVSNGGVAKATPIESTTAILGEGASTSLSGGSSEKSLSVQRNQDISPNTLAAGFHLHESSELAWHGKEMQVEDGWIIVKGKKDKSSRSSFDMTLCSHKKNIKCKS